MPGYIYTYREGKCSMMLKSTPGILPFDHTGSLRSQLDSYKSRLQHAGRSKAAHDWRRGRPAQREADVQYEGKN